MENCGYTSKVYNNPNKILGLQPFYYRWRGSYPNLNGNTPADQYQKQKLIQNTVRVYAALYPANLGPLTAYTPPIRDPDAGYYGVCWNQMSDRPVPSVQPTSVPTGFHNSLNTRHYSVTSSKPGSQTPGGKGCDIKHNSYDRYLNRLKGKGPLRRGVVPPSYGVPLPFNPAYPIYGGKTIKTNIVSTCDCPIVNREQNLKQNQKIYGNPLYYPYPDTQCTFNVGDHVYAIQEGNTFYSEAIITNITGDVYTIQFNNGIIQTVNNVVDLKIYFPCNCDNTLNVISTGEGCSFPINSVNSIVGIGPAL
jgi:hypothetical protein